VDSGVNGIQNNPERLHAATPAPPVSGGPGWHARDEWVDRRGASWSGKVMRQGWKSASAACVVSACLGLLPGAAPAAPPCDEYNPFGPSRIGEITLNAGDFADEDGTEMLTFIETESMGKVDVQVVQATPARIIRAVSAEPETSMVSPYFGERLKGIRVAVSLTKTRRPVSIVLKLRQVCAKHFRNTFLYY
jgi:hypothetical protein